MNGAFMVEAPLFASCCATKAIRGDTSLGKSRCGSCYHRIDLATSIQAECNHAFATLRRISLWTT
jgi:hypothetical protein